jgi:hypothetical protein
LRGNAISLPAFLALNNVEDDLVTFFQAFVTVFLNRAEMDEDIVASAMPCPRKP